VQSLATGILRGVIGEMLWLKLFVVYYRWDICPLPLCRRDPRSTATSYIAGVLQYEGYVQDDRAGLLTTQYRMKMTRLVYCPAIRGKSGACIICVSAYRLNGAHVINSIGPPMYESCVSHTNLHFSTQILPVRRLALPIHSGNGFVLACTYIGLMPVYIIICVSNI
jgi:hypothetical protein